MSSYTIETQLAVVPRPEEVDAAARRVIDACLGPAVAELVKQVLGLVEPLTAQPVVDEPVDDVAEVAWMALPSRYEVHVVTNGVAGCGAAPFGDGRWRVLTGVATRDAYRCARCERLQREAAERTLAASMGVRDVA